MGILDSFKVNRSIQVLLSAEGVPEAEKRQALATLHQHSSRAVPRLIEALADPQSPPEIADLLLTLLHNATLPLFFAGLSSPDQRVGSRIMEILSSGTTYDPNLLLDLFQAPEAPRARVAEILSRQKHALNAAALLRLLDSVDAQSRTAVLRLVDEVATDAWLPELIRRTGSEEWLTRLYIARTLRRFSTEAARDALTRLLDDPHKSIRQAALEGLAAMTIPVDIGAVCKCLRDPDLTVQAKAIETIVQLNDPGAVHHLLDSLQDESEYVRRAAVEVLNQVGNTSAIKDLLGALRDRDWWVRVRAADALGTIGGPKVVEAVVSLVKDRDEFIRRCAIEILNSNRAHTGNETVFQSLVEALEDEDWWVRERAIDALAGLGDRRAVPPLLRVMERDVKAAPVAIRALASLGDPQAIRPMLTQLRSHDKAVRAEAFRALATLTDEAHAEVAQRALREEFQDLSDDLRDLADKSLRTLATRFGDRIAGAAAQSTELRSAAPPPRSLLQGPAAAIRAESLIAEPGHEEPTRVLASGRRPGPQIDAATLEPGVVLAERYRVLRHIGSGAFGVVVLVEDLVVGEEVILKFLKPQLAADDNVISRFIQELRYARRITHENVIRIYDFIAVGNSYAISMEYFPSRSLASLLEGGVPLPVPRAFTILRAICRGMGVAHRTGIVHRDLKPENVLLNEADLVKIVDFGVAAASSQGGLGLTKSGLIVGTPAYMAPEQAQGGTVDPRTDIYSLGVIMYEMLAGRQPYVGRDPVSILVQHVQGKPTPPSQVNPGLSPTMEAMILKAMALDPADRLQSMEAVGQVLDSLVGSGGA
ncbi:MAG TPA: HEAT repeat domain-containing protein [Candidatus Methylomirabilis sp.]|nr:HEAT repeat domain-containing protein [Candidatus Methylomirabilis sp.]